jgi:hypothetical protein
LCTNAPESPVIWFPTYAENREQIRQGTDPILHLTLSKIQCSQASYDLAALSNRAFSWNPNPLALPLGRLAHRLPGPTLRPFHIARCGWIRTLPGRAS